MTKLGKKLIAAAHEGIAIARGEADPATYRVHIPAKVDGSWQVGDGELKLKQDFQTVTGTLSAGGTDTPVKGSLRGDRITFTAGSAQYTGRVNGSTIVEGAVKGGASDKWAATKK